MNTTRGERNCNPGNIERGTIIWDGMAQTQGDSRFVTFKTPEFGIRALAKILLHYFRKDGLNTVQAIITKWAPPVENDDTAYINHVCRICTVEPDTTLNVENPDTLEMIVRGIILHENGRCIYDDATIVSAIQSALI